jgi:1,4-dihydroxy-2-naphthoyl-CoA hydrolase
MATFCYGRSIVFADTDAAGVVYFARFLSLCHEAYEASLQAAGIDLKTFFQASDLAVPIVQTGADFLAPLTCGDRIEITLTVSLISETEFRLDYDIWLGQAPDRDRPPGPTSAAEAIAKPAGRAFTRHVCIDRQSRRRRSFSPDLSRWSSQYSVSTLAPPGPEFLGSSGKTH